MSNPPDWRLPLLEGATAVPVGTAARNPIAWPGYTPRRAVHVWRLRSGVIAAVWDFSVFGGSFGEDDATALVAAARAAVQARVPLLTLVRSGGTRLQEGVAALVGIPRARMALLELAAARLPHLSVADAPTTGGVWVSVASAGDLRVAVEGATVGFAGPRVVQAVTGKLPGPESHTATAAYAAGLVDAVLPGPAVPGWIHAVLSAVTAVPGGGSPVSELPAPVGPPHASPRPPPGAAPGASGAGSGWQQVLRARGRTTGGAALLDALVDGMVPLRATGGDTSVVAGVGRVGGRSIVGVAVAAQVGARPTPAGYRLAARAYRLGDRLDLPVLSLVDTPGAEPGPAAEQAGVAPAIGEALDALLLCRSPTLALVHGEGGSGGAVAAAAADLVLMTPDAYFAAIGPEGAAATLRRPPAECADLLRLTPADVLALGVADAIVTSRDEVAAHLDALCAGSSQRLPQRRVRWSSSVPFAL